MGNNQASFLNADLKTVEVNRGNSSVTQFQRIPTSIKTSAEPDIQSQIYDFKHSFKRFRSSISNEENRPDANEALRVGDADLLLMIDLKEGNLSYPIGLDTYITSNRNNITFLNGQVYIADNSNKLALYKMFANAQQYQKPQLEKLSEIPLPSGSDKWIKGYSGELSILFTGSILVSPGVMKLNQMESMKEKLRELPEFESKLDWLMNAGKDTDVELRVGTKVFHTHKEVLIERSRAFEEKLTAIQDRNEENHFVLEINDISEDIMEKLIHFIYTDITPANISEKARELLPAANTYGLEKLKLLSEIELTKTVNHQNVCGLCTLASNSEATNLLAFTKQYITENIRSIVSGGWGVLRDMPKQEFGDVMKVIRGS